MSVSKRNEVTTSSSEELMLYKKSSLSVVSFQIVHDESDLETSANNSNSFKPDMAHQIFGETELIFGYRQLSIKLYYLHNSAKCYVDVQSADKIAENNLHKADDIMKSMNPWLPEHYATRRDEFRKQLAEEQHSTIFGEVIHTFDGDKDKTYKVTLCNMKDEDFKEFHQRFETYIVWFIDGANFIDLEDTRWSIFYVYEEYVDPNTNKMHLSPIGFCTVYKFYLYPNSVRPKISQFFVLPTHQRRGIGSQLYSAVVSYLRKLPEAGEITVEEPTEIFQNIRDLSDSFQIYKDLQDRKANISTQNQKEINMLLKKHKICKRQAQRVFDILKCLIAHKSGYSEYLKFTESIRTRIRNRIQRETSGSKRLCNLERAGMVREHVDKEALVDAEYNKYINSLEWPVNHLKTYLSKLSA